MFPSLCQSKETQGYKEYGGETEITNVFLVRAGCEAIMNSSLIVYPREFKELTFYQIKIILKNIRPQKVVCHYWIN